MLGKSLLGAALAALTLHAPAQDIKLPGTLTVTAYDTGSSGFNMAVAIGKAFKALLAAMRAGLLKYRVGGHDQVAAIGPGFVEALPVRDDRSADDILGYDERGLPT